MKKNGLTGVIERQLAHAEGNSVLKLLTTMRKYLPAKYER